MKPRFSEKRNDVILVQDRISTTAKRALRPALKARRITPFSLGIQPIPKGAVVINFGGVELPKCLAGRNDLRFLNTPEAIRQSANKLATFKLLEKAKVESVRWTVDRSAALEWFGKGHKVLARTNLSSSGGRGIRVANNDKELGDAPLYTRYFPKTHEFRVHVVDGVAVDLTEKKLREDHKDKRAGLSIVRSHNNGWVHAHDSLSLSANEDLGALRTLGVRAVLAAGLDFGCADILAVLDGVDGGPRSLKKAVVCEVNSAPGIENTVTRQAYVRGLNKLIEKRKGTN